MHEHGQAADSIVTLFRGGVCTNSSGPSVGQLLHLDLAFIQSQSLTFERPLEFVTSPHAEVYHTFIAKLIPLLLLKVAVFCHSPLLIAGQPSDA